MAQPPSSSGGSHESLQCSARTCIATFKVRIETNHYYEFGFNPHLEFRFKGTMLHNFLGFCVRKSHSGTILNFCQILKEKIDNAHVRLAVYDTLRNGDNECYVVFKFKQKIQMKCTIKCYSIKTIFSRKSLVLCKICFFVNYFLLPLFPQNFCSALK